METEAAAISPPSPRRLPSGEPPRQSGSGITLWLRANPDLHRNSRVRRPGTALNSVKLWVVSTAWSPAPTIISA